MATAYAPPLFLGERGRQLRPLAPLVPTRAMLHLPSRAHSPVIVQDVDDDEVAAVEELVLFPDSSLTAVAAAIEGAKSRALALRETDLAPDVRCRIGLATLQRRAGKRGKVLVLRYATREARGLAEAAGWKTEPLEFVPQPRTVHSKAPKEMDRGPQTRASGISLLLTQAPRLRFGTQLSRPRLGRAVPIGAAVTCVALAAGVFLLPSAQVSVVAASEAWNVDVPIAVDPAVKKADIASGRLPGRTVTRDVSETATAAATGKKTVPDAKASGEVVLLNRSDKPVQVPKGTVVVAGPVKFVTQVDVTVAPSRVAGTAQSFGMASAKVMAVTGGTSGNVGRDQINKVEGPLASALTVQNNTPARGGTERATTFVTEEDRKKLQESLTKTLSERLAQQVKKESLAGDKETLVPWPGQNAADVVFSKSVDDEAQTFTLTLKMRFAATVFSNDAYNTFVKEVATANLKRLKPGFEAAPGSMHAEAPVAAGVENGILRLSGRARATISAGVDEMAMKSRLAGKPVSAAHAYLAELPGNASYDLRVSGPMAGRMPFFGGRIGVSATSQ